jgi:hypothetical protein
VTWYENEGSNNILSFINSGVDIVDDITYQDKNNNMVTLKKPDKINLAWVYRFASHIVIDYIDSPNVWRKYNIGKTEFNRFVCQERLNESRNGNPIKTPSTPTSSPSVLTSRLSQPAMTDTQWKILEFK